MGAAQFLQALVPSRRAELTAQQWREEVAQLEQKLRAARTRLDNNGQARNQLALVAAQGDTEAQSALDITSAEHHELLLLVDNAERAVTQARRYLAMVEQSEGAARLRALLERYAKALRDRSEAAVAIEATLAQLKRQVDHLVDATDRARRIFNDRTQDERDAGTIEAGLDRDGVSTALIRGLVNQNLAEVLAVKANPFLKTDNVAETIRAQNRRAELTSAGKARVLHPEPPAAA